MTLNVLRLSYIILQVHIIYAINDTYTLNTLFFQSALGRQSAVETKSPNQGQSATRWVQSATEEGQTETWESQFDIA